MLSELSGARRPVNILEHLVLTVVLGISLEEITRREIIA